MNFKNKIKIDKPLIDTVIQVETPEGVKLSLYTAGPFVRFLAFSIDLLIQLGLIIFIGFFMAILQIFGTWLFLIILFFIVWFYPVFFEVFNRGRTPGKMIFGIQVMMIDGTPIGWNASILRNLLRIADCFFYCFVIGLIALVSSRGFRRLGDLAAGTIVVYCKSTYNFYFSPNWQIKSTVSPIPSTKPLTVEEQKAIVDLSGRLNILGSERAKELAKIVAHLIDKRPIGHKDPVSSLISIASFIVGYNPLTKED